MSKKYQILVIISLFAVSCNPANKLHKMMDKLPEASAKECAQRFPIIETIDTIEVYDTALLKAYEMEFNYLYYYIDSLLGKQIPDSTKKEIVNVIQEKKVPVVKYKYITKTQEGSANVQVIRDSCQKLSTLFHKKQNILYKKIELLNKQISSEKEKCYKLKKQRNNLLWILIALLLIIFRKQILFLVRRLIFKI